MQINDINQYLLEFINTHIGKKSRNWLTDKIDFILEERSTKDLYLTYSLIPSRIELIEGIIFFVEALEHEVNTHQIARIYLLNKILKRDQVFFQSKVAKLIEVADKSELETFLKFLILLPNPEYYKSTAINALRTNVSTIFKALAHNNPYPSIYFDDQQWNQMYLKTAFMQEDLSAILDIDKKANKDLARIISDYAHERWAAGRDIDPYFWRPVTKFLNDVLIEDMKHLLKSDNVIENRAAVLCCFETDFLDSKELLKGHKKLIEQIEKKELTWYNLKDI